MYSKSPPKSAPKIFDERAILGELIFFNSLENANPEKNKGSVKKINLTANTNSGFDPMSGIALTLPHMGWNQVDIWPGNEKSEKLCKGFHNDGSSHFYFVHSYIFKCEDSKNILMTSYYAEKFTCAINKENIFGTQFHPEKSGENGLKLIKNFIEI